MIERCLGSATTLYGPLPFPLSSRAKPRDLQFHSHQAPRPRKRTADPSASLGMTKDRATVSLRAIAGTKRSQCSPDVLTPPQSRHPERKRLAALSHTTGLRRGAEGPRRCLLADAVQSFLAKAMRKSRKVTALSVAEDLQFSPQARRRGRVKPQIPRLRSG